MPGYLVVNRGVQFADGSYVPLSTQKNATSVMPRYPEEAEGP